TEGWKHSPGHRKNMLDRDVTETGVAVAWSKETGHYYAVQMFGRPKSLAIEFQIANEAGASVQYQIDEHTFSLPPRLIRTHHICRPVPITFIWSSAKDDRQVVTPKTHEHFSVIKDSGKFQIKHEVAP
ncbi:MAG TPA: CAP domain-containing protein, partial [Schlesneria sp.]